MDSGFLIFVIFKIALDYFSARNKVLDIISTSPIVLFCGYQLIFCQDPASRVFYGFFLLVGGGYLYWRIYKTSDDLLARKEKRKKKSAKENRKSED